MPIAGETLSRRRCLVTGGLGFIGSNLVHRLVGLGADVRVLDSLVPDMGGNRYNLEGLMDRVDVRVGDMRDLEAVRGAVDGREIVFNVAGQVSHVDSMTDPMQDLDINLRSHLTFLEGCRRWNPGVKIVYVSTRQVYGPPQRLPVREDHPLNPVDINGVHKQGAEWYHVLYHRIYGIRSVSLRLTNTYGPRQLVRHSRQGVIPWFVRLALDHQEIQLFGGGNQKRDCTYVDDLVDALLIAAERPDADGGIYNIGGDLVSLRELVTLLFECAGGGRFVDAPFPPERKAIDIGDVHLDDSTFRDRFGWSPRVSLREGIRRTVEFYRKHREYYW